jgi:hypothetical protein
MVTVPKTECDIKTVYFRNFVNGFNVTDSKKLSGFKAEANNFYFFNGAGILVDTLFGLTLKAERLKKSFFNFKYKIPNLIKYRTVEMKFNRKKNTINIRLPADLIPEENTALFIFLRKPHKNIIMHLDKVEKNGEIIITNATAEFEDEIELNNTNSFSENLTLFSIKNNENSLNKLSDMSVSEDVKNVDNKNKNICICTVKTTTTPLYYTNSTAKGLETFV